MKTLSKSKIALVVLLNVTIAIAYYLDNLGANYSELSSDIQNIIPVAQKFDNPDLFKDDLYLNTIENVKYYTPFYVQTLRFFAKYTNYNYVQAINIMGLICHLLFGILWFFLLFKFVNNYWVCFLVSIVIRGVIWLPGLEIWGISDLWTIMPRTVYITLMPIPFLLLSHTFKKLVLASFLIGFIFNFHPITGLGGVLLFVALISLLIYFYPSIKTPVSIGKLCVLLLAIFLGLLPFIITYFGKTSTDLSYDVAVFNEAFNARIPAYFQSVTLFLKQWLKFKTLFFLLPLVLFFVISFKIKSQYKISKLLLVLTLILIVIPTLTIPLEDSVNSAFSKNIRMSFQLVRLQKVAIIPGFFALAFILSHIVSKFKLKKIMPYIFVIYCGLLVFSQSKKFKSVPFFGDDISATILPHNLSAFTVSADKELAVDRMANYIKAHTPKDAIVCGTFILRGATKRSVVFDGKGASMLIEGNPKQFMLWQERQKTINSLTTMDQVVAYLKQFNVDYFVTKNPNVSATLIHQEGSLKLYKL